MKRNLQLDGLRGLFLVIMTIDHLQSPLAKLTYEKIGYVTAAEGFVFLSGYLAGKIYTRYLFEQQFLYILKKALNRSWEIYKYHLITLLLFFFLFIIEEDFSLYWRSILPNVANHISGSFILSFFFFFKPDFLDILPLYCVFIMIVPFFFLFFTRKLSYEITFLLLIVTFWFLGQVGFRNFLNEDIIGLKNIHFGNLNIYSWQLLFMFALWLGYREYKELSVIKYNHTILSFMIGIVVAFFLYKIVYKLSFTGLISFNVSDLPYTGKENLEVLRIVNFFALTYVVSYILGRYSWLFKGRLLVLLGQNSLQVYTFHLCTLLVYLPFQSRVSSMGPAIDILITFILIASLYIPAFWNIRRNKKKADYPHSRNVSA